MCAILHNLVVCMQQNRYLRDESGESNLVMEFFGENEQAKNEAPFEYEENQRLIQS